MTNLGAHQAVGGRTRLGSDAKLQSNCIRGKFIYTYYSVRCRLHCRKSVPIIRAKQIVPIWFAKFEFVWHTERHLKDERPQ
jgi:hypothetical protein